MASASAAPASPLSFPSGSWTLYFHDPEDTNWTPDSYKKLGSFSSFEGLWGTLQRIGSDRFLGGMFFLMKDPFLPLWEHRSNKRGGSYCIKIPEASAEETFQRYAAAAVLGQVTVQSENTIVGVSISPKKGFHIMKLWNLSCTAYNKPTDVLLYGEGMKLPDVIYRPHVEQKM
jgi:hypothetical protein